MTSDQVREARKLLGWSKRLLGVRCGIPEPAIAIYENTGRVQPSRYARTNPVDRIAAIRAALEAAGVEFTDGDAPGVKLRKGEP